MTLNDAQADALAKEIRDMVHAKSFNFADLLRIANEIESHSENVRF